MAANHTGEFFYPVPMDFFVQKIHMIDKTKLNMRFLGQRRLPKGLELKVGKDVNLSSWGEEIIIVLTPFTNGTHIRITSECTYPLQMIDWGVNASNVTELFHYFEFGMPGKPGPKQPQNQQPNQPPKQ